MNSGRIGNRACVAVVGASLLVGSVVGCSAERGPDHYAKKAWEESVAPERLCGGNAVSAKAGEALKVITGSSRFEASSEEYTVTGAAEEISAAFSPLAAQLIGDNGDICRIHTPVGTAGDSLRLTWHLSYRSWKDAGPPSGFTRLDMGEYAAAAPYAAHIKFVCRSEKLPGSTEVPGYIRVGLENRRMPRRTEGDPEAMKRAFATVTHSVSVAMVKQLRCQGETGVGSEPSLDSLDPPT